jgi:hypothetical protein
MKIVKQTHFIVWNWEDSLNYHMGGIIEDQLKDRQSSVVYEISIAFWSEL